MIPPLPQLRPLGRGKAYYEELRALYQSEGAAIKASIAAEQAGGKLTITATCRVALRHRLRLAALYSFLEDECGLPCGTYDRLKERGLKPMAAMQEVWEGMDRE